MNECRTKTHLIFSLVNLTLEYCLKETLSSQFTIKSGKIRIPGDMYLAGAVELNMTVARARPLKV